MSDFNWSQEDRYRSNGGKGPLIAKITHVDSEGIHLLYGVGSKFNSSTCLSEKYFLSKRCGWKLIRRRK